MTTNDAPSPGGWFRMLNARVFGKLVIGLLAANGAYSAGESVFDVYGKLQGAQASYYCEARLVTATPKTVTYACLNPLPEGWSGAVLASAVNGIFVDQNPAPATRIDVGTSTGAAYSGQDIMNNVSISGSPRWLSTANTGSLTPQTLAVLSPRNYGTKNKKYLTFTFTAGSGGTTNGLPAAFARFEIIPCNLEGVGC